MIPREASVRIVLDPQAIKRETDALRKEMTKLVVAKKRAQDEIQHFIDGTARVVDNADPNSPNGTRSKPSSDRPEDSGAQLEKPPRRKGVIDAIDSVIQAAKVGFAVAKQASTITAVLAEAAKDTWFAEAFEMLDEKVKEIAEKVIDVESKLIVKEVAVDVVDYHLASFKLGGKPPTGDEELKILEEYWRIHSAQMDLTKTFALERERELAKSVYRAAQAAFQR
jgi:hypothetical protein